MSIMIRDHQLNDLLKALGKPDWPEAGVWAVIVQEVRRLKEFEQVTVKAQRLAAAAFCEPEPDVSAAAAEQAPSAQTTPQQRLWQPGDRFRMPSTGLPVPGWRGCIESIDSNGWARVSLDGGGSTYMPLGNLVADTGF